IETQYSVPPRTNLNSLGPNPSEKTRTRTPCQRASRKCPSSCTNTRTPSTKMKGRMLDTSSFLAGSGSAGARRVQSGPSIRAGPGIEFPDVRQRPGPLHTLARGGLEGGVDAPGDGRKRHRTLEERRHRDLVG